MSRVRTAHVDVEVRAPSPVRTLASQRFVEVSGDPRAVGFLIDLETDAGIVEFFHSASCSEQVRVSVDRLERTFLSPQTRVYFRLRDERWWMGRVRNFFLEDNGSVTYEVRLPNKQDIDVSEAALRVRAFVGAWDPTEVLALGASETQRWSDARWPAREAFIALRAAAQGLTGVASASVELVGHQLAAIRRILHDPLQRYLLADEVGLGKTIEACAVLRQTLLDNAYATALVVAPAAITAQWERELIQRFDLRPVRGGRVEVISHNTLDGETRTPTILVVDEAHKIEPTSAAYKHLARVALAAPKLLLLSATPTIGREAALLALLRLLDPERWANEPEARFAEHVARSQDYGRLLLGLRPDASAFVLRQRVAGALALFPEDIEVARLVQRFQTSDDSEERRETCAMLAQHIADTYRIHHRLIRNRRANLDGWEFQPRGPASVRIEEDDDPSLQDMLLALEDWRAGAALVVEADPALTDVVARRYQHLLQSLGIGVLDLAASATLFDGEAELLQSIAELLGESAQKRRAEFVAEVAQRHLRFLKPAAGGPAKLVVFASDTVFAEAAAAALRRAGLEHVFDASRGQDVGDDFQACCGGAVAVFGPSGEEGLNLHFADAIVHADLPTSVGRLEQRIGRLDRFGRTRGPIKHVLIYPAAEDDTVWSAWTDLLRDGFGVFDRPVSDLQFVLDEIEVEVRRRMLRGPQDLLQFRETLAGLVAQHRERLDEQYAMDQLAVARDSACALADAFEDAEADEEDLQARVGALLTSTLQFEVRHNGPDVFSLDWARNTQLPDRPWRSLFMPGLNRALTWKRRLSVARPQVSLLRPGSILIEALERLLEWDDRGAAFATWRLQPGGGGVGEERLAFRLCWIVTPATPAAEMLRPGEDADGLRRQAEGFLQPWTLTQHIGPDLQPIEDADWLDILERPYQPETKGSDARDFNLGSRSEWLEQVIDRTSFAELCARTSRGAGVSLSNSEAFRSRVAAATIQAQREMDRRAARRSLRAGFDSSAASARAAELDALVYELVSNPAIRLDCIGVFVVSGYVPHIPRL